MRDVQFTALNFSSPQQIKFSIFNTHEMNELGKDGYFNKESFAIFSCKNYEYFNLSLFLTLFSINIKI